MRKRDYFYVLVIVTGLAFGLSPFNTPQAARAATGDPFDTANHTSDNEIWQWITSTGKYANPENLAIGGEAGAEVGDAILVAEGVGLAVTFPEIVVGAATVLVGLTVVNGLTNQIFHLQESHLGAVPSAANISTVHVCPENANQACAGGSTGHQPSNCFCAGFPATDTYFTTNNGKFMQFGFGFAGTTGAPQLCSTVGSSGAWNSTVAGGASSFSVVIVPTSLPAGGSQTTNGGTCLTSALQALNDETTALAGHGSIVTIPNAEMRSGSLACSDWAATAIYSGSGACPTYTGTYVALVVSEQTLEQDSVVGEPCSSTVCSLGTADYTASKTLSPPLTATPNPTVLNKFKGSILGSPGADTPAWARCVVDPAEYACPGQDGTKPFILPQPLPSETYQDYSARLRALGYIGSIVLLDDPGFDGIPADSYALGSSAFDLPGGAVTGVGAGLGVGAIIPIFWPGNSSGVPGYSPLHAPGTPKPWDGSSAPSIAPLTTPSIVIMHVPAGYTPPAGSPSPTPPAAPGAPPGSGSCNLPTIPNFDLTPLTGLSFGSQFPFGVFTWLSTVYGYFNVSAVAPAVDINLSGLSTFVPGFSAHYAFDLTYFNTYMGTIRTLISFALWVGAIWYVGTALLGFRAGGDVSDAADEGMEI